MFTKTFKLYRVTFACDVRFANGESYARGESRSIRASSMQAAGMQSTRTDGSDISGVELVAVDCPMTGKQSRSVARLSGASTRHMLAFPAKVLARHVMNPSATVRVSHASNTVVGFKMGGAF